MNPDLPPADALPPATKRAPSNLRLRVIWGTIAAALLIGCTYGGPISFGLFFAAVQAVMLKEFYRITRAAGYAPAKWIGIVASVVLFAIVHAWLALPHYWHASANNTTLVIGGVDVRVGDGATLEHQIIFSNWLAAGALTAIGCLAFVVMVLLLLREMRQWPKHDNPFGNAAMTFWGLLYVSLPMALLQFLAFAQPLLHGIRHYDPHHVFCLIILVWAADTGAYIAGKNFGKHKLAPSISPGKTWEGWAGGALLALATGWAFGQFVPDIPLTHRLVAAGVVAVFGPLGDLAESMLKRSAGVKDSGTFLPGHGGLLDRFDAFLLVLPVLVLLQLLAG
ncbi:phosphatidate cytidylyltransferase [Hymenobacter coccineus]|uniref:phosphatidate cytidylyltransferase n=1 Tax=Hymenobacter coccineus TaxID=1908235 RepID=UPI00130198FF|nr:phosphatidate cytidylyltransferase [Hymenobacter coccineus]